MSGVLGALLVVVPILAVGVVIVIVVLRFRRGRDEGSRETFATFVGDTLAPPHFSTQVPGSEDRGNGSSSPGSSARE